MNIYMPQITEIRAHRGPSCPRPPRAAGIIHQRPDQHHVQPLQFLRLRPGRADWGSGDDRTIQTVGAFFSPAVT